METKYIYTNKDGRQRIVYKNNDGKVTSKSYPRYIMEEFLGRELDSNEQIHHKDGNPLNNDIENLEVVLIGEHQRLHSTKYIGKFAICDVCGKQFYWDPKRQYRYYSDMRMGKDRYICCSKSCSGIASHGQYKNILKERNNNSLE